MQQLRMWRYVVDRQGQPTQKKTDTFSALINPAEIRRDASLRFSQQTAAKAAPRAPRLHAIDEEKLAFTLVLDGTGVVPVKEGVTPGGVDKQLQHLSDIVYAKAGPTGDVARVYIIWGTFSFYGRLTSMSVTQTLFSPEGEPLRAKVALAFAGEVSPAEAQQAAGNPGSAAGAQTREVKEGDTLAQLCDEVYGDPAACQAVARHNGLATLRDLVPGTQLEFPPRGARP